MNRNKYKWLLPLIMVIVLGACKKNLDLYPLDAFTEPTYFKTETDLRLYANLFYNSLPNPTMDADNNSDNMAPKNIDPFLGGTYTIPGSGGGWATADWTNIRRCNYFLKRYTKAETNNKEMYAAEVRLFRALFYWEKVKRFGDVPLVMSDLNETSQELYGPRVAHKIVMDSVLNDLNFAVANLPLKANAATGRLHLDAANALKARICLWEGTFRKYHGLGDANTFLQEAVTASNAIISSNRYSVYNTGKPNEDYRNLFIQRDLNGNTEAIMHRAYIKDINTHGYTRTAGENNTGASKDFVEDYLFIDGKPIGATSYTYNESTPAAEVQNRDPRYPQTIATPGFVWTNAVGTNPAQVVTLPTLGTSRTSTGYWLIKARSSDLELWNANQDDIDRFIFRYAETLLINAEAKYELGTLAQSDLDATINKLRRRVGMPDLTMTPVADPNANDYGYVVAPILYEIRRERRVELVGEGFRFDDILRWKAGKLIENVKTFRGMQLDAALKAQYNSTAVNNIAVDANNYIIVYPSLSSGRTWSNKMYLYPLPLDQITLAKYTQNPGWN